MLGSALGRPLSPLRKVVFKKFFLLNHIKGKSFLSGHGGWSVLSPLPWGDWLGEMDECP